MPIHTSDPVFQNIRFRDCIHRGVAGATPEAILAAATGDVCAPIAPPVDAGSVYVGVSQVLGPELPGLWSEFQLQGGGRKPNPIDFASFLAAHPRGRALPALPDLAAFDLAYFLAAQPSPTPSIGTCCLTEETIRLHPELILRFQPGWRTLRLDWPVHRLLAETVTVEVLRSLSRTPTGLRIAPGTPGIVLEEMAPGPFALETALRNGQRLADAIKAGQALDPALDPIPHVAGLVQAGAIIDAILHPAESAPAHSHRPEPNPS